MQWLNEKFLKLIKFWAKWVETPFGQVLYFAGRISLGYGIAIGVLFLFSRFFEFEVSLLQAVLVAKLASLSSVAYAHGEYAFHDENEGEPLIKNLNKIIFFYVLLLIVLVFIKLGVLKFGSGDRGYNIYTWLYHNSYWLTSSSIFAYASLDFYIAFFRKTSDLKRKTARMYFIFADVVTILPFALINIAVIASVENDVFGKSQLELFLSGSLAVTMLAYGIATQAVKVYNK